MQAGISLRRYLRFSLRAGFLLLTIACLWLGYHVTQARRQREAVQAFLQPGRGLTYGYQSDGLIAGEICRDTKLYPQNQLQERPWPAQFVGIDFVSPATTVRIKTTDVGAALPNLKRFPRLKYVYLYDTVVCSCVGLANEGIVNRLRDELADDLPGVEFRQLSGMVNDQAWPAGRPRQSSFR